jgi:hypothetical protein
VTRRRGWSLPIIRPPYRQPPGRASHPARQMLMPIIDAEGHRLTSADAGPRVRTSRVHRRWQGRIAAQRQTTRLAAIGGEIIILREGQTIRFDRGGRLM